MNDAARESEKKDAEAAILVVLGAIEAEGRQPDDWEKKSIVHALDDVFRGLYRLALSEADLALTPKNERNAAPVLLDPEVAQLDLVRLKAILDEARLEPVRPPLFGRWV
jgi:hypothetical protein